MTADLSAGGADIDLDDVAEADFSVSAGAVDARLTGTAPRTVTVDVSAGALELTLPEAAYDVRSDVSAGEFENGPNTEPGARNVDRRDGLGRHGDDLRGSVALSAAVSGATYQVAPDAVSKSRSDWSAYATDHVTIASDAASDVPM